MMDQPPAVHFVLYSFSYIILRYYTGTHYSGHLCWNEGETSMGVTRHTPCPRPILLASDQ